MANGHSKTSRQFEDTKREGDLDRAFLISQKPVEAMVNDDRSYGNMIGQHMEVVSPDPTQKGS